MKIALQLRQLTYRYLAPVWQFVGMHVHAIRVCIPKDFMSGHPDMINSGIQTRMAHVQGKLVQEVSCLNCASNPAGLMMLQLSSLKAHETSHGHSTSKRAPLPLAMDHSSDCLHE